MEYMQEYLSQEPLLMLNDEGVHVDEHTDQWVDEGDQPHGHSGHCNVHTNNYG